MAAITSQWWRRLVNAYEVKAGMVCLQCKNCMIHIWAHQRWASHDGAIYKFMYLYLLPFKLFTHTQWRVRFARGRGLTENFGLGRLYVFPSNIMSQKLFSASVPPDHVAGRMGFVAHPQEPHTRSRPCDGPTVSALRDEMTPTAF